MKIIIPIVLLLGGLGCDEHLPPHSDPSDLLDGTVSASYVLTATQNRVRLRMTVVNTYDEVIEGESSINGIMSLSLVRDPSVTRTFTLSETTIEFARMFNPMTGYLTLTPGDSVVFASDFLFIDDLGRDLREYFPFNADPSCPGRLVSDREVYLIRAKIDLFPRLSTVVAAPIFFELCHVTIYIEPNYCPPVLDATSACVQE